MAWQDFKLLGFCPDLPVTTPGYLINTDGCIPTDRGIGDGPGAAEISTAALNTISLNGALLSNTSATQELIVGTATKLYGFDLTTTLTDRSGGAYNATTTDTWSVTQFGNIALAVNRGDQLQQRTIAAAANFASVGVVPVPKASIVVTCGPVTAPFVMVFDYLDGVNTDKDGWKCSAVGDYTGWTSGTNSCATGRLLDNIPGPVTAAIPYRDGVVAWKRTGMYVGRYDGPPQIWSWQRISSDVGCISKNACVEADDAIYFAADSGLWIFDGSYPRRVPGYIQKYWTDQVATLAPTAADRNFYRVLWDKAKHVVHFLIGSAAQTFEYGVSFNTVSGLWTTQTGWRNAAATVITAETIAPRYFVSTTNKKIGQLTFGSSTPDHPACLVQSWCFSDWVHHPKILGIRPHWSGANGPSETNMAWLSGTISSAASERAIQPGTATVGVVTSLATLVARAPGKLDGQGSAPVIYFTVNVAASNSFELTGFSADVVYEGKS